MRSGQPPQKGSLGLGVGDVEARRALGTRGWLRLLVPCPPTPPSPDAAQESGAQTEGCDLLKVTQLGSSSLGI